MPLVSTILLTDPGLAPIRPHPDFQALVREMAGRWIERAYERGVDTQPEYRVVATRPSGSTASTRSQCGPSRGRSKWVAYRTNSFVPSSRSSAENSRVAARRSSDIARKRTSRSEKLRSSSPEGGARGRRRPLSRAGGQLSQGQLYAVFAVFLASAFFVYEPALSGPFLSDDLHYVRDNVYVHSLSAENVLDILDPTGGAAVAVVNYSPVHLLLHSVAWSVFGNEVEGHHVINIVLHALASVLLLRLLMQTGVPRNGALFGAAFFLMHPANVEAVAWISQLKSSSSMVLSLGALLAFSRRPGLGMGLFIAAILAKPTAAFVLPVAFLLARAKGGEMPWKWLGASLSIFIAFAVIEFTAHQRSGAADAHLYETPFLLVRTVASLTMRYFAMATTSYGVSAFHEPDPPTSLLDPWWLGSVFLIGAIGWRSLVTFRARKAEAAYWAWAAVSFAPISQVFPFLNPMADRYLYFILPGLIGGALLWGRELMSEPRLARIAPSYANAVSGGLIVAGAIVLLGFAWHSHARARIWRSSVFLMADSARNYPEGVAAHLGRAARAAQEGDVDTVVGERARCG